MLRQPSWISKVKEIAKQKTITVYGAGSIGHDVVRCLSAAEIPVSAIVVSDFNLSPNKTIYGIPVNEYHKGILKDSFVIISAANKNKIEIQNRLMRDGFNEFISADYDEDELGAFLAQSYCQRPIDNNKIVFYSFGTYSDHGKYITEELLKLRNDLDIVWILNDVNVDIPTGIRVCSRFGDMIYELETAHMWVFNMVLPPYIIKRSEQIYVQTKHWGSITLKKFYLDSKTLAGNPHKIKEWRRDSDQIDYIITGSGFDTESCRRGFAFKKTVFQIGSCRSDGLFRNNKIKIFNHYKIDSENRIILYCPTYRYRKNLPSNHVEARSIDIDFERLYSTVKRRFGGEWLIFLRLHPSLVREAESMSLPKYVIDVTMHHDSEELVALSDIMVTDYSSIMFEAAYIKRPVFLFATDQDTYINSEYDLLIDYHELPFPIADSNNQLMDNIWEFDIRRYIQDVTSFLNRFGICEDGHASERAAAIISGLIDGELKYNNTSTDQYLLTLLAR